MAVPRSQQSGNPRGATVDVQIMFISKGGYRPLVGGLVLRGGRRVRILDDIRGYLEGGDGSRKGAKGAKGESSDRITGFTGCRDCGLEVVGSGER